MEKAEKVVEAVKFVPFTSTDWMGMAGAECFPDGTSPLIGYLEVDGNEAMAAIDANGLTIFVEVPCVDEGEDGEEPW